MEFVDWEPIYESILADFGYGRGGDERARDELAAEAEPFDTDRLDWHGDTVAVAGAGPSLEATAEVAREADTVVAASTATDRLTATGVAVDLMVTDLDKNPETVVDRTRAGEPVAVHAHGDNRDLLAEVLPDVDTAHVLPTTQAAPSGPVVNYGGFTDGDRAAYLADALGAAELRFCGWDFDDETLSESKARKLWWAERLLERLERDRDERFGVLDDRRDEIERL
ncbi:6-hydroxymethylpterin diphosphokinase MptE-like protein [Halobaculum sp. MBLA0147]|uniref:6-hydroxymethylpterin diphosphokinase MptE-like protein n=1 Tax=Halobaculum sp. MBLA0147 TaxID=3079934 RepID=UPI003523CF95